MDKKDLLSLIEKYHLGGIVEKTKIISSNNNTTIKFVSPKKDLTGEIFFKNTNITDSECCIMNTSQLVKLVKITEKEISIEIEKQKDKEIKILLSDSKFKLDYRLADNRLIPDTPLIDEPTYDICTTINKEFVEDFLRAQKAISSDIFTIEAKMVHSKEVLEFVLGGESTYTNKIKFNIPNNTPSIGGCICKFPLPEFKAILDANDDMDSGLLKINSEGLMRIEFNNTDETKKSIYYLIGSE